MEIFLLHFYIACIVYHFHTCYNCRDYASNLFDINFILALFKTKMSILYTHAGILQMLLISFQKIWFLISQVKHFPVKIFCIYQESNPCSNFCFECNRCALLKTLLVAVKCRAAIKSLFCHLILCLKCNVEQYLMFIYIHILSYSHFRLTYIHIYSGIVFPHV